jgi:hypothetical protein
MLLRWRKVGLLLAAGVVAGAIGCERSPTEPAASRPGGVRAITLVDWTADGYANAAADTSIQALAATGANTIVIIVTAYQAGPASSVLRANDPRTPTPASVAQAITWARTQGLSVTIKPHVDLDDGSWRGHIDPASPAEWFASYREFVLGWASFAATHHVTQFVVGTELAGTLQHEAEWDETIRAVREVFSGALVYAASWDEAGRVPFWRDVDLVGVDFYFPVAQRAGPGRLEILAQWQPWLERLHLLHRQTGRPVLLTEIGYRSVDGAGMHPSQFDDDAPIDLEEQADLYWAALQAVAGEAWIAGVCWWNWPADGSGGPNDDQYTPRDKPAASVLAASWRE